MSRSPTYFHVITLLLTAIPNTLLATIRTQNWPQLDRNVVAILILVILTETVPQPKVYFTTNGGKLLIFSVRNRNSNEQI